MPQFAFYWRMNSRNLTYCLWSYSSYFSKFHSCNEIAVTDLLKGGGVLVVQALGATLQTESWDSTEYSGAGDKKHVCG